MDNDRPFRCRPGHRPERRVGVVLEAWVGDQLAVQRRRHVLVEVPLLPRQPFGTRVKAASIVIAALSVLLALPSAAPAGVRVPTLDWAPCADRERFDCATARVPLDYRDPGGARIRLAVIRHRATRPARRIGTVFFSPGGPAAAKAAVPEDRRGAAGSGARALRRDQLGSPRP